MQKGDFYYIKFIIIISSLIKYNQNDGRNGISKVASNIGQISLTSW